MLLHEILQKMIFYILPNFIALIFYFLKITIIFDYLEKEFPKFLDNNITNLKSEFLIPDLVFKQCIEENIKVEVINTSAKWLGVTYKEDKENVVQSLKKLVDDGEYKKGLW